MTKRAVIAGVAGGVVLFLWYAIAWMVMPWSEGSINSFEDDDAATAALLAHATESGVYFAPSEQEAVSAGEPLVFAAVRRDGLHSMGVAMAAELATDILVALIAAWLLLKARPASYGSGVAVVVGLGLAIALAATIPNWSWWGFSAAYVGATFLNILIGWTLAGLVMARLMTPRPAATAPPASERVASTPAY